MEGAPRDETVPSSTIRKRPEEDGPIALRAHVGVRHGGMHREVEVREALAAAMAVPSFTKVHLADGRPLRKHEVVTTRSRIGLVLHKIVPKENDSGGRKPGGAICHFFAKGGSFKFGP